MAEACCQEANDDVFYVKACSSLLDVVVRKFLHRHTTTAGAELRIRRKRMAFWRCDGKALFSVVALEGGKNILELLYYRLEE